MGQNDCNTKRTKETSFTMWLWTQDTDFTGKTKQCTQGAFANSRHFRSGSCGCNDPLHFYMSLFGDSLQAAKKKQGLDPKNNWWNRKNEHNDQRDQAVPKSRLSSEMEHRWGAEKCKNCVPKGGIRGGKCPLAPVTVRRHHLHLQPGQG